MWHSRIVLLIMFAGDKMWHSRIVPLIMFAGGNDVAL